MLLHLHSYYMHNKMASTTILTLMITAILLFIPTTSQPTVLFPNQPLPKFWKLAIYWPNSFCHTKDIHCIQSFQEDAFLIHSLYPLNQDGQVLSCSTRPPMDYGQVEGIMTMLSQYWPNLQGNNSELWQQEWQMYASCFGITPFQYFANAIELKVKVDMRIVDARGGYPAWPEQVYGALYMEWLRPGTTYLSAAYYGVLSSESALQIEVQCNNDTSGVNQLLEFHICADGNFSLLACPGPAKLIDCNERARYT